MKWGRYLTSRGTGFIHAFNEQPGGRPYTLAVRQKFTSWNHQG